MADETPMPNDVVRKLADGILIGVGEQALAARAKQTGDDLMASDNPELRLAGSLYERGYRQAWLDWMARDALPKGPAGFAEVSNSFASVTALQIIEIAASYCAGASRSGPLMREIVDVITADISNKARHFVKPCGEAIDLRKKGDA
ncbi:hypothetical protein [Afifella aestuarii]|uniref:hypothetical protein n=1 Tax=Afifella aestuarii TaxID=1909496 RepID=UPI000FE35539|nr:hypothetical protein [Afifella aestuarii]